MPEAETREDDNKLSLTERQDILEDRINELEDIIYKLLETVQELMNH